MSLLVGFSPHKDDHCAIDLACQLARSGGDDVTAVTVVPQGWPTPVAGATDREFERWAAEEGGACAEEARALLARHPDVASSSVWRAGRSVPQTLLTESTRLAARAVVIGSGPSGPHGAITITSKGERLLHSSPVAVALAPRGYRAGTDARITRADVAFRGDDASWSLLDRAAAVAREAGASLRLLTLAVRNRPMYPALVPGGEDMVFQRWVEQAEAAQAEAIDHLGSIGFAPEELEGVVATGRRWDEAFDQLEWTSGDLLVVGSSSSSIERLSHVFLGSSASKVVRHSPVPVLVVPPGRAG